MTRLRLGHGELVATVSGAALLAAMFLPWTGGIDEVSTPIGDLDVARMLERAGIDVTANAWQAFTFADVVLGTAAVVAIAAGVIAAAGRPPKRPRRWARVVLGLGIAGTLLAAYRLLDPPGESSREIGLYLGPFATAGIAYGGWCSLREHPRGR